MIIEELRDYLADVCPEAVLFDNPSFDKSIIGLDASGERVIYDLDKMVEELSEEDGIDPLEALEFIEYNTIRALPYIDSTGRPVILERGFMEDFIND